MQSRLLKVGIFFLLFLFPAIFGWIHIKTYYNYFITNSMFALSAKYYDLAIIDSKVEKNEIVFTIKNALPLRDIQGNARDFTMDMTLDMEAVTFNIPMTISILLAIILSVKISPKERWEIFYTGFLLLFMLHMLSMLLLSLCTIKEIANINPYIHYYLHKHMVANAVVCAIKDFLINYAARFEPFLIAFFAWYEVQRKVKKVAF